jgi:uncharacterized protein (DUF169 family)
LTWTEIADSLIQRLILARPPIGLAFLKDPPAGVRRYAEAVPSACAFWKAAERELFYATAEDHYNCSLGAITQGFPIPQNVGAQAMELIEKMGKLSYFEAAEAQNVPTVKKDHKVIVYGPLKDFGALAPDIALLIANPFQAMMLSEIGGVVSWTNSAPGRVLGRPACAVIPSALESGAAALSVGCMGARTFAGIQEEELLVAVPAQALAGLAERAEVILRANAVMRDYYQANKARFSGEA